jgi:hypothetical protein
VKAIEGNEPWKILVKNNIYIGSPTWAKYCRGQDIHDILALEVKFSVKGSNVFKSLWKGWNTIKPLLGPIQRMQLGKRWCGRGSIWWNLKKYGKPLALVHGCSIKK